MPLSDASQPRLRVQEDDVAHVLTGWYAPAATEWRALDEEALLGDAWIAASAACTSSQRPRIKHQHMALSSASATRPRTIPL